MKSNHDEKNYNERYSQNEKSSLNNYVRPKYVVNMCHLYLMRLLYLE